jgi:hypothetical protein
VRHQLGGETGFGAREAIVLGAFFLMDAFGGSVEQMLEGHQHSLGSRVHADREPAEGAPQQGNSQRQAKRSQVPAESAREGYK